MLEDDVIGQHDWCKNWMLEDMSVDSMTDAKIELEDMYVG